MESYSRTVSPTHPFVQPSCIVYARSPRHALSSRPTILSPDSSAPSYSCRTLSLSKMSSQRPTGYLQGSVPGLLDPTQSRRLLCDTETTLLFATFDPRSATGDLLSAHDEVPPGRRDRIVIETTRGASRWRFVPPPVYAPGGVLEASWPKCLTICG